MKTLRFVAVLGVALAMGCVACAGEVTNAGSQAVPWLGLPDSARVAAMGGASVALAEGVDTLSVNPAGLGSLSGQQVSLMHDVYVQNTSLEHVAYGIGLGGVGGVAAALDYMNYGSVEGVSDSGEPAPNLSPYGDVVQLGYGHSFGPVLAGATLEGVTENLSGGATNAAFGCDLGLLWKQNPTHGASVGMAVQNIGSQLDEADLPTNYQGGLGYRFVFAPVEQALALALDASVPSADATAESLSLGAEYSGALWAMRAGWKFVGNGGAGGLSVGGGLRYEIASLDYAFVSYGDLGAANQISLSAKF